jgi:peptidoglycan/LPS O-acetylase OafA/YrhL
MKNYVIIDLIRSFSILSIMVYHLGSIHTTPQNSLIGQYFFSRVFVNGSLGIPAFFLISGFLITALIAGEKNGLFKPDLKEFYSRRVGRILPLYLLVVLIYSFMTYTTFSFDSETPRMWKNIQVKGSLAGFWFSIFTFTFNWYKTYFSSTPWPNLWGILWAISIEVQFYFLYPLLLRVVKDKRRLFHFSAFSIVLGLIVHFVSIWYYPDIVNYNSFIYFGQLALGCLLFLASQHLKRQLKDNPLISFALFFAGFLLSLWIYLYVPSRPQLWWALWHRFLFGLGIFFMLLGGIHHDWFNSRVFRVLAWPGRLSYGLYLFHVCVLYFLWDFLKSHGILLDCVFYIAITCFVAFISYRYFETPLNQFLRKKLNPK